MHPASTLVTLVVSTLVCASVLGCTADAGRPGGPIYEDTSSTVTSAGEVDDSSGPMANAQTGCKKNDDCESNVCFVGGKDPFCTVQCTSETAATDCAPPFTGSCNKRGYCKRD